MKFIERYKDFDIWANNTIVQPVTVRFRSIKVDNYGGIKAAKEAIDQITPTERLLYEERFHAIKEKWRDPNIRDG